MTSNLANSCQHQFASNILAQALEHVLVQQLKSHKIILTDSMQLPFNL